MMADCGYEYTHKHGMVEHRRRCPPPNRIHEKWIRMLQVHFDIFTRQTPEGLGGDGSIIPAVATMVNMQVVESNMRNFQ